MRFKEENSLGGRRRERNLKEKGKFYSERIRGRRQHNSGKKSAIWERRLKRTGLFFSFTRGEPKGRPGRKLGKGADRLRPRGRQEGSELKKGGYRGSAS